MLDLCNVAVCIATAEVGMQTFMIMVENDVFRAERWNSVKRGRRRGGWTMRKGRKGIIDKGKRNTRSRREDYREVTADKKKSRPEVDKFFIAFH